MRRLSLYCAALTCVLTLAGCAAPPPPPPEPPPLPPEVKKLISDVQARVAGIRGLESRRPVSYKPLTPQMLEEFLRKTIDEQLPPDLRRDVEFLMRRLGLLAQDKSLDEIFVALFGEQVAGLYDQKKGDLYVVTSFDLKTSLAEMILAHEICHALQDQHFDLSEWPLEESHNDDMAYAGLSVLEGDATILMQEYGVYHMKPGRMLAELPGMIAMMGGGQPALEAAPYFLQHQMIFPYIQGAEFMASAIARGERDRALKNRPRSTEQIMHPAKFFSSNPDEPTTITLERLDALAPKGWTRRYYNTMGEMGVKIFLEANFVFTAAKAAAGWDGDRVALYAPSKRRSAEGRHAVVWITTWDTEEDAVEFLKAMRKVVGKRLIESKARKVGDGDYRFENEQAAAALTRSDKDVIYIDASAKARRRLEAFEK